MDDLLLPPRPEWQVYLTKLGKTESSKGSWRFRFVGDSSPVLATNWSNSNKPGIVACARSSPT